MEFFQVDRNKCTGDGRCVFECPIGIIELDKRTNSPKIISGGEKLCINCGHCLAVCPHGAISFASIPLEDSPALTPDWRIPRDRMEVFLKARRSVRLYKKEAVKKEVLEKLLDIARFAPSGINRQPVCWSVIYEKGKVWEFSKIVVDWMRGLLSCGSPLAGAYRFDRIVEAWDNNNDWISRQAPHLFIAYALKDDPIAAQDCTIALTYLELAAVSFGLGSCWAGYAALAINMCPEARKFTGISSRAQCYGAMILGYPNMDYYRLPQRNKARVKWQ